ncbi:isochorismatase family protein, partial [Paenibacillus sepulcri]|nr:isochorismatase family protein [Paenibacillus sepulcri]
VESTARHGYMLDYNIAFVADGCAAFSQAEHDTTLSNIDRFFGTVVNSGQLIETWESMAAKTVTTAG